MRLLVLMGLLYFCYRFLKSWVLKEKSSQKEAFENKTSEMIDNVMVKDPYCEVYFAKRDGVHLNFKGRDVYFCSKECKDKFLEKQTRG